MGDRVIGITVLYNDFNNFKNLFKGLNNQTYTLNRLIIIDNSNVYNRNNFELFKEAKFPINYIKTRNNIGSAGGFALGMAKALELGFDWIWLNDSDGVPAEDCLEFLLKHSYSKRDTILVPQKIDIRNNKKNLYMDLTDTNNFQKLYFNIKKSNVNKKKIDIIASASTGILIGNEVLQKVGIYDFNHYFVGFEDIDYFLRCKMSGIHSYLIKSAVYYHPDLLEKHQLGTYMKFSKYLPLFLGNNIRIKRFRNSIYSGSYMCGKYCNFLSIVITLIYSIIRVMLSEERKVLLQIIRVYIKGILEGLRNRHMIRIFLDLENEVDTEEEFK